ncbi:MAG TPA: type II secretion system protein GspM [Methylocystis sp.]|nr:type II secretion system protein GspM [Methylocystis sp.]
MNLSILRQNQPTRRAVFIAGHLLALLLLYFLLVDPIRRLLESRAEELQQRQATLSRYESVAGQEAAVKAFAAQVAESNARGELIAGEGEGLVSANLQARLKALAEAANATVRQIQPLPVKNLRGTSLVGFRLDVNAPIDSMHALARALESETPLLLVTSASIRGQTAFWGPAQPAQPTEASLDAQFDVYGGSLSKDHS